ncbi:hypothetical protein [Streptomyces spiramyceticus]|uniref:hypothetical protein n=1 Tax=Streptomyces spiramyceticus TaxID=299717 RepID=UPI00237B5F31|nr:hypothetical protein [Streptomyces spiramyceticus]
MRVGLRWAWQNIDGTLSVLLAAAVSVLGVTETVSDGMLQNAIALTLAVLAFTMLRDRSKAQRQTAALEQLTRMEPEIARIRGTLEELPEVTILTGQEITQALRAARDNTDRWYFKGSTATYVRAVTLPECVDSARRAQRKLDVGLEILDPTDLALCQQYADLFRSLSTGPDSDQHSWTADGTRRELYATILAACWHLHRYRLLDIRIGLTSSISTFRWELSSSVLIITQRGPQFPAMMMRRGRALYNSWSTELDQSLNQARAVPLREARHLPLSAVPTPEEVRTLFLALGMALPDTYTDDDLRDLSHKAVREPDPYRQPA